MSDLIFERIAESEAIPPQLKKLLAEYLIANGGSAEGQRTNDGVQAL